MTSNAFSGAAETGPGLWSKTFLTPLTRERISMRPMTLLLLSAVLLCGVAVQPSSAADQPEAPSAAIPAVSPPPAQGPLLVPPAQPPAMASAPAADAVRVGVVDMERVSRESARGKAAQATVKEQQQKVQKQLDDKRGKLDKMRATLEQKMPTLQPAQRDAKIKEFQKKVDELQKFGMNAEKELMETQKKLTKELLTAIEEAAGQIGKASKLALVTIKGDLFFVDSGVALQDISDEIVKLVDDKAPQK
jgi:outer membrane protein